ncbi:VOC family protein [Halobellus captivus]|uniref:VOC family protein n=1 Tax=Halobellus captivus TaxID=2592614 RepID=UPI0011A7F15B|nr:VOC family protein [Halobellus captivus]
MADSQHPRRVAHVGVTVPDIEAALEWYEDVLGWTRLKGPRTSTGGEGYGGRRGVDVLGEYESMNVAHLLTGGGVAVEFFEFEPAGEPQPVDPKRPGLFHLCVIDPDVAELASKIDRSGGDHYAEIWRLYEDSEEFRLTYCRDPFGNLIEIYSHSHEQMHAVAYAFEDDE